MDILNNPWITGIGGGIISSLIVFFVTRYAFSKKEKREYTQKIETANNEILYAVRPLIIEKKIPSNDILESIKISTSKKYGVTPDDLYSNYSLSADLTNEIMNNSFLSSDQKVEFCELLQTMKTSKTEEKRKVNVEYVTIPTKDTLSSKYNSILLAMVSFASVLVATVYITKEKSLSNTNLFDEKFSILIIATLIPLIAVMAIYVIRLINEREKIKQRDSIMSKIISNKSYSYGKSKTESYSTSSSKSSKNKKGKKPDSDDKNVA